MPELPEISAYIWALEKYVKGQALEGVAVRSPFLVRTFNPSISTAEGLRVTGFRRMGKRIVWEMEDGLYLVFHLMVAGRFRWTETRGARPRTKSELAAFHFEKGTLMLAEAGHKKRASLYVVEGEPGLSEHDPGGLEVLASSEEEFREALGRENHTLKRALTDPRLFSGIGNTYSDEILHMAGLSPVKWTSRLVGDEPGRLYDAACRILGDRLEALRSRAGGSFPQSVSPSKGELCVHGKHRQPCPNCGTEIQRIRYSERATYYCPRCQTGGRVLADRSLSRLLRGDWPQTVEELEARRENRQP